MHVQGKVRNGVSAGVATGTRRQMPRSAVAGPHARAPEAESPTTRSDEQEVAAGRTASTPVAAIATVAAVIAVAVVIVAALVVLGFALA
jgi:hypothetical protein